MDLAVGQRIRDLRREHRLSLEAIAATTDLSIGFLSQIERGLSSPSLRVLATLADVLGVGIAALFGSKPSDDPASGGVVTRQLQRAELKLWRTGISKQLLSPAGTENRLNLFLVHLEPGGNTGDELYTHDGEEAGLVLEGEMTLTVDAETWSLKTRRQFSLRQPQAAPLFKSCGRCESGRAVGELRDAGVMNEQSGTRNGSGPRGLSPHSARIGAPSRHDGTARRWISSLTRRIPRALLDLAELHHGDAHTGPHPAADGAQGMAGRARIRRAQLRPEIRRVPVGRSARFACE